MNKTTMYCPHVGCEGHAFTDDQLEMERRAMRPFSLTRENRPLRVTDADRCFRDRDAARAKLERLAPTRSPETP